MPRRRKKKRNRKLRQPDIPYYRIFNELFPPEWIREKAKETGMLERERKIDVVVFFWTLVLSFGIQIQRTLTGIRDSYEQYTDETIAFSSFYERFQEGLVAFLKEAVNHGLEEVTKRENVTLSGKLKMFKDVSIIDNTVIKLHEALASTWKACLTKSGKAACKLSIVLSVIGEGPRHVKIYGERRAEIKTLTIGPWVKGRLLLFDLGFFKYQLFDRINRNGGFFLTRLKKNANPFIVSENRRWRGNSIRLEGKRIKDVLSDLKRQVIDTEVEISFSRRPYNGKRNKAAQVFRMVGVLNKETGEYHLYITNIPIEMMCAEDVAAFYGYRWTIELLVKELKSTYRIDVLPFENKEVVEALIYTAILSLLISRRLLVEVRSVNPEYIDRIPRLRWSRTFAKMAGTLIQLILRDAGIENPLEKQIDILLETAIDPNVSRKRLEDLLIEPGGVNR